MATARLNMRLDDELKIKLERAATLMNKSLTDYILGLVEEDANQVISEHENIEVTPDAFTRFWEACDKIEEPNSALKNAVQNAREQGHH